MGLGPLLLGFVVLPLLGSLAGRQVSGPSVRAGVECAVTKPNGIAAREQPPSPHSHGDSQVSVVTWPDGTVEFRPGGAGRLDSAGLIWTPSCGSLISRRFRSVVAFSTLRRQQ